MLRELLDNQIFGMLASIFPFLWIGIFLFIGRKKVNSIFEGVEKSEKIFREKGASGYSKRSIFTRFGGARNALDVFVTDSELCIKGTLLPFSVIGLFYDLTHRTALSNINNISVDGNKVEFDFQDHKGIHQLVLILKDTNKFVQVVKG